MVLAERVHERNDMRTVLLALTAFCFVAPMQATSAQDAYPNRAIKLIVPFAAGGNTDVVGRLTASNMQKVLYVNVVVENRAGAGGINGTDAVAKAAADGYTLCICGIGPITVSPATEKLPYDPLKDLAPNQPDQHQSAGPRGQSAGQGRHRW